MKCDSVPPCLGRKEVIHHLAINGIVMFVGAVKSFLFLQEGGYIVLCLRLEQVCVFSAGGSLEGYILARDYLLAAVIGGYLLPGRVF